MQKQLLTTLVFIILLNQSLALTLNDLVTYSVPQGEICGNSVCESLERCDTCSADCGSCPPGGVSPPPTFGRLIGEADRHYEFTYKNEPTGIVEEDVLFSISGSRIVQNNQDYFIRVIPSLKGTYVAMDVPPTITILNPLKQVIAESKVMSDERYEGYTYRFPFHALLASGVYTTKITLNRHGRIQTLTEEWRVILSQDLLLLEIVSATAPTIGCKLILANEGDYLEQFVVSYWITTDSDGKYSEGVFADQFTKKLVQKSNTTENCLFSDMKTDPFKICSKVEDAFLFDIPPSDKYPVNYWCKVATCRGNVADDCKNGVKSEASKLLSVHGVPNPLREVSEPDFFDFALSEARILWPSRPYTMAVILIIFTLLLFCGMIYATYKLRKKIREDTEPLIIAYEKKMRGKKKWA